MKNVISNSMKIMMVCVMAVVLTGTVVACGDDDDKDMTSPTISDKGIVANPVNCQAYHPGDVIPFRYVFEDDMELGSYNIEIHGNFDHHSHSTEADDHDGAECEGHHHDEEEAEEEGVAWVYNKSFQIPAGQRTYDAQVDIPIPADIRHGDYHFMVRVTDKAGWQQLKAVAIIIEGED